MAKRLPAAAVHGGIYLLVCTHAWSLFASRWTTSLLACWTSRLQADGLQVHGPPWQLDGGMQRRIRWNTDDDRVDRHRCTDKRWIWLSYHVARQQNCDLRLHRTGARVSVSRLRTLRVRRPTAAAVALGKGTRTRLPCWHYVSAAAHMERSRLALTAIQHVNHNMVSTCSSSDSAACVRCCDGCGRHIQSVRHHVIVDQQGNKDSIGRSHVGDR